MGLRGSPVFFDLNQMYASLKATLFSLLFLLGDTKGSDLEEMQVFKRHDAKGCTASSMAD